MTKPTVAVIGLGVVGGAVYEALKDAGYETLGYSRSKQINSYDEIVEKAKVIFLVPGTPARENGTVNMDAIHDIMENLDERYEAKPELEKPVVVIKSTVIPGTNATLSKIYPGFTFVSSPEFLTELTALSDFKNPDRTVIGTESDEVFEMLITIYDDIEGNNVDSGPIMHVSPIEAELIKYFSNLFLATKVIFANEANKIAQLYGAEWNGSIATGVGMDHRIGDSHFQVTEKGGFGGMCFPKDTKGLYNESLMRGYTPRLLETVIQLNEEFRSKEGRDPYTNLDN